MREKEREREREGGKEGETWSWWEGRERGRKTFLRL